MAVNCTEDQVCFQADAKYEKGDKVIITIQKGCVGKTLCDAYSKGDIEECKTRKAQGTIQYWTATQSVVLMVMNVTRKILCQTTKVLHF